MSLTLVTEKSSFVAEVDAVAGKNETGVRASVLVHVFPLTRQFGGL
jgi:hypothetical protein